MTVLQKAYDEAYNKGKLDGLKYQAVPQPVYQRPNETGGATQLAAYVAHATARGYYEAGPVEVEMTSFRPQPATRPTGPRLESAYHGQHSRLPPHDQPACRVRPGPLFDPLGVAKKPL